MKKEIKAALLTLLTMVIIALIFYAIYLYPVGFFILIASTAIASIIRSIYLSILEES